METCIGKTLDPPRMLYVVAPPTEALPLFYPIMWPNNMESYDGEKYVELVGRLQRWGEQVKVIEAMMKEVFEKNPNPKMCKNMFKN